MANQRQRLTEGFVKNVGATLRQFFARSPENVGADLRRGGIPSVERAGMPFNLVSQFGFDGLSDHLRVDQDLQSRYADYEEMDEYPEISAAIDIYADDATMPDMEESKSVWITGENQARNKELDEMLHRRVLIEDDIWGSTRTLSKYGNDYGELLVSDQGLLGINYLPPPTMRRIEDPYGKLIGFLQDTRGEFNISLEDFYELAKQKAAGQPNGRAPGELTVFEDWEIIHWRLRGKHMRSIYGHSVVDAARWIWKRLATLEDAILIYKLSRAPSRYAFYVDVGELDNNRGLAFVNQVKNGFIKKKFLNPQTGKLDMRHNPLAMDEDFFIPTRAGKDSTRIEVLQGPDYAETDTLEYHRDKLVSGLKVPKTYLGYGGEATRASLSSEDIRFARTVMRIQREVRGGLRKACRVHLVATGQDHDDADYDVMMSVPSAILELAKLEVLSATADVAQRMGEAVPTRWILTKLYKFSEEEAEALMQEKMDERLAMGAVDAKVQGMSYQVQAEVQNSYAPQDQGAPPEGNDQQQQFQSRGRPRGKSITERERPEPRPLKGRRLSQMMTARRLEWQREFDTKPVSRYAEDKLHDRLRTDVELGRRLRSVEGLMGDIRSELGRRRG